MPTNNFFMQERKSNLKRLVDFIKENGFKETCPECGGPMKDTQGGQACKSEGCKKFDKFTPMLRYKKLIGLFIYQTGATKHTLTQYINDLTDAGLIEFVSEKDTFRACY